MNHQTRQLMMEIIQPGSWGLAGEAIRRISPAETIWIPASTGDNQLKKPIPPTSWVSPKMEMRDSPIHGQGLFARAALEKNEVVLIWGGEGYTNLAGAQAARAEGKPVMQWDDDLFSHPTGGEETAYRINHCCEPNVWMQDAFTLTAREEIEAGRELTIDHAMFIGDEDYIAQWICNCGSPKCRHRITGNDWRIPELQAAYANHFSPLINQRIGEKLWDR